MGSALHMRQKSWRPLWYGPVCTAKAERHRVHAIYRAGNREWPMHVSPERKDYRDPSSELSQPWCLRFKKRACDYTTVYARSRQYKSGILHPLRYLYGVRVFQATVKGKSISTWSKSVHAVPRPRLPQHSDPILSPGNRSLTYAFPASPPAPQPSTSPEPASKIPRGVVGARSAHVKRQRLAFRSAEYCAALGRRFHPIHSQPKDKRGRRKVPRHSLHGMIALYPAARKHDRGASPMFARKSSYTRVLAAHRHPPTC